MKIRIRYSCWDEPEPQELELSPADYFDPPDEGEVLSVDSAPKHQDPSEYTGHTTDELQWALVEITDGSSLLRVRSQFLDGKQSSRLGNFSLLASLVAAGLVLATLPLSMILVFAGDPFTVNSRMSRVCDPIMLAAVVLGAVGASFALPCLDDKSKSRRRAVAGFVLGVTIAVLAWLLRGHPFAQVDY